MSDEELLEYYNEYVASRTCLMSVDDKYSVEMLSGFADQAVKDGLITDTPKQRAAVTKAVVRAEFKAVVAGGNVKGYTTAATLLNHSLQDYPQKMLCPSGSGIAAQIGRSSECTSIVNSFKKQVRGKNITSKTVTGTATLKSTTDLHLAFNKVSYQVVGKKYKGKWNLTITFTDRYDFETQAWRNSMTDHVAVTAINNYAAYAQSIGAIVPYDIKVFVVTSF